MQGGMHKKVIMGKFTLTSYILFISISSFGQKNLKVLIKDNEKSIFLIQCFNEKKQMVSTGSGFFIDKIGVAYTNVHVIKDAFQARIKTIDGKFYPIEKIIDYNSTLDIAKIKIENRDGIDFHSLKIASKNSEKGDEVFTIGNPDGLESSVSTGIVSSIRSIPNYGECYQTTASISPGSSGGPLFNMDGEVIGITSFGQIDPSRLNQSLNFAVNINNAKSLNQNLNLSVEKAYKNIMYEAFIPQYMESQLSGDYESALKICTEQLNLNPNSGTAYHLRATTLLSIGELTLAESDFKNSLLYSESVTIKEYDYIGLAIIYRKSGQYLRADECYKKAAKLNNKNPQTYCGMSMLIADWMGEDSEFIEPFFEMALKIDPTSCPFGYKYIGSKLAKKGEYEKAIPYYSMAIETETKKNFSINEYYNRATCYYHLKKYELAISDFKKCITIMPTDAQSYHMLGLCNVQLGRNIDACSAFNKAYAINRSFNKSTEENKAILDDINNYCK